jgi:hypothetical protein
MYFTKFKLLSLLAEIVSKQQLLTQDHACSTSLQLWRSSDLNVFLKYRKSRRTQHKGRGVAVYGLTLGVTG